MKRCYLAGPDVFHPEMPALAAGKRELCARHGLLGCFPLDNATDLAGLAGREAALAIYHANIRLIESCDLLVANLTPFRGVSADPGTVFELGYMSALGRPVAGYSLEPGSYLERARQAGWCEAGSILDRDGQQMEDFGLGDNLMLAGALQSASGDDNWIMATGDWRRVEDHLKAFDLCLRRLVS